ncbi:RNA polymerase recycling motor HelD [Paenibacillus sediminis]|uniref:DNA helicase-2/ATP-dependent DNA helicase PcrA n=1 Tax=Paenibacillus sediminis TaxID=664909 RepID=A0ABS4H6G8_9BACL|nr:RNA polymerase recycling motor HelD [Paenibacillus sediminis]MBP1938117.1 DNA helicase-2/ATP-dependent DNA helicase PcrA [Paenibacillus sediminis]
MSTVDNEWREEQQRVDEVTGKISRRIKRLEQDVGSVRGEVVTMRKDFWDEVTVNFSEADDVGETSTSLRQQSEILSERERRHLHSSVALGKLKRLVNSPYFGRIDFKEDGETKSEQIYLGIASFLDDDNETFLIYDWRAPISNLYYDSTPGPASYETPSGDISGSMSLKRQFVIRDAIIRYMFDTGVTIGDELLQEVLSRSSDAQMKSIVATIQKEQNQIIRNDKSRMLIVQGAAGSGKTSAALQRVAYLLYKYRGHLQADQVVLFSPNPMFNSYVSTVLPELGEENMLQTTLQEYLEHRLGREFQLEDPFEQIEYVLSKTSDPGYAARISSIRYKSSLDYLNVINAYKELLAAEGMMFRPVRFQGEEVVSAEKIKEMFYSYDHAITMPNRLELVREWLLKEIAAYGKAQWDEPWVEEAINLLEPEDYQRAYTRLRRKQKDRGVTFDDFEQEKEILARMIVSERLKPLRKWVKSLRFVDYKYLYGQLFQDELLFAKVTKNVNRPEYWDEICKQTLDKLRQNELNYEDVTPFLYLKEHIQGFRTNTTIRHVFIDEAQDYSPFQLSFMKRMFPRARMTALGDFNQAIYAHASVLQNTDVLMNLYDPEQTERIVLTRSYRSTREIVQFTRGMIPGGEQIVPFNRSGELPKVIEINDRHRLNRQLIADIDILRKDGYETIAVICKTASESARVHEALKSHVASKLIKKTTLAFEKGVHIIPAYLAKGVEFDAVLIYDGSKKQYALESERKLFYTACTRAMHLLHVYSLGEVSPFIAGCDSETYEYSLL